LILHQAATGELSALIEPWTEQLSADVVSAQRIIYWAILCTEGWSRNDPAEISRIGGGSQFLDAALRNAHVQGLVCNLLGYPLPAPDTGVVPKSSVPLLFVVGAMDPQDPLDNVAAAPQSLPNAQILVVPGGGHVSVHLGCLPRVAMRFFNNHHLVAADRACAASVRPPAFVTP
jgi:pimeloyl-ACP methyl ester carboxylesterase